MAIPKILGLHHVSAIASDAQANVDFYAGVLGLKLVKQTVNFDDPTGLHLYYGDATGSPGSLVTFFIIPGLPRGKVGWPQVTKIQFGIRPGSAWSWADRLERVGRRPLTMSYAVYPHDPDGLRLRLHDPLADTLTYWAGEEPKVDEAEYRPIGPMELIRMRVNKFQPSLEFFQETLGFGTDYLNQDFTFLTEPATGNLVAYLEEETDIPRGRSGAGTVHHVAFRIGSEEELGELRASLVEAGVNVSPVRDRVYFKSIYFREPGGILLEVATDGPGFAVDEPPESLGRRLCLPPWLESRRAEIEVAVPRFTPPRR